MHNGTTWGLVLLGLGVFSICLLVFPQSPAGTEGTLGQWP